MRVPLLTATKEILDKYKGLPGDAILPLVSQQKYNIAIKKILKHAGIDRTVTWLNPTTGEPEPRPIYEVNCNLHDKLLEAGIPHEFHPRPGSHTWTYWKNAIKYHFMFFADRFERL